MLFYYIDHFVSRGWDVRVFTSKVTHVPRNCDNFRIITYNLSFIPRTLKLLVFNYLLGRDKFLRESDVSIGFNRTIHNDIVCANGNHIGYLLAKNTIFKSAYDYIKIYLDQLSFDHAKVIIACSPMIRDELITDYKVPSNKIHVLLPPVDTTKFNNSLKGKQQELQLELGMRPNGLSFLFVSTGHSRKGLELLLNIFSHASMQNSNLYVAGLTFRHALSNVHCLGYRDDMHMVYSAADLLLHPATYEPFGLVVPESLACGTPVIISQQVGAKSLVMQGYGIISTDLEPKTWISLLKEVKISDFSIPENFVIDSELDLDSYMFKLENIMQTVIV